MITKNITFEDLEGNQITQPFYFNVSKAELIKLQTKEKNGLDRKLRQIANNQDVNGLITTINEFIEMSYGEKSADGQRFVKVASDGHKLGQDFIQTEAYNVLFMELATNADAAIDFITGILPAKVRNNITPGQIEAVKNGDVIGIVENSSGFEG